MVYPLMEREAFFSGYCRVLDQSRMVAVEAENETLLEADCAYPDCVYQKDCPIGQNITDFLKEQ